MPVQTRKKYARGLVQNGFDSLQGLRRATIDDLTSAGMSKGHARQVEGAWESSSSSGSSSSSRSSSTTSSASGDSSDSAFDRCDHTAAPKQIQLPERGRKRDTRLSRYDSVCILCRCVTVSLCHCPTVSPFTCLTDVITQQHRNKFSFPSEGASETHVSQGMTACAYCVAVSLCHCVTVPLCHR